jgi:hypothetical protein
LGFSKGDRRAALLREALSDRLQDVLGVPVVIGIVAALAIIKDDPAWAELVFVVLAFVVGYVQWIKNQRNANVDDAMDRKDRANDLILANAELLMPYVGNVFGMTGDPGEVARSGEERTVIQMFVFTELDNLEFVYDKARAGLMEDEYSVRAIRVFVARGENRRFYEVAYRLVGSGRYNEPFVRAVQTLLFVAQMPRTNLGEAVYGR